MAARQHGVLVSCCQVDNCRLGAGAGAISVCAPYRRVATVQRMAAMRKEVRRLLNLDVEEELPVGRPTREKLRATKVLPESDTSDRVIARLRRDKASAPEAARLYRAVTEEGKTANAAAREMG